MDYLFDDSREDRLIEDYLFSGYRPGAKSTTDQQFAKPIEDEDIFGINDNNEELLQDENAADGLGANSNTNDNNTDDDFFDKTNIGGTTSDILCDRNINSLGLFNGEIDESSSVGQQNNNNNDNVQEKPSILDIDQIFVDDYSQSPEPQHQQLQTNYSKLNNNNTPNQSNPPNNTATTTLSPAQLKKQRIREKALEFARALSCKPKLGTGFNEDGTVEFLIEEHKMVSTSESKTIFNKSFNRSKKARDSHNELFDVRKEHFSDYKNKVYKSICAKKRKIWDSFQRPSGEVFDEEEEIVEIQDEDIEDDEGDCNDNDNEIEDEEGEEMNHEEEEDEDEGCDFGNLSKDEEEEEEEDEICAKDKASDNEEQSNFDESEEGEENNDEEEVTACEDDDDDDDDDQEDYHEDDREDDHEDDDEDEEEKNYANDKEDERISKFIDNEALVDDDDDSDEIVVVRNQNKRKRIEIEDDDEDIDEKEARSEQEDEFALFS